MNEQELRTFIDEASGAFDTVARMFREDNEQAKSRAGWWLEALENVQLDHARKVLAEMVRGDLPTPDYEWGKFPGMVRKRAQEIQQTAAMVQRARVATDDEQPRYACLACRDTGLVDVYNRRLLRDCREEIAGLGPQDKLGLKALQRSWRDDIKKKERRQWGGMHGSAVCNCQAGSSWLSLAKARAEGKWRKDRDPDRLTFKLLQTIQHYDAYNCCRFESGKPEEIHDWLESRVMDNAQEWNPNDAWT